MPKPTNLSAMFVDQLLKLRSDVEQVLIRRTAQLRDEFSKLSGANKKVGGSSLKGRKAPIKFRDKSGNTWAGRGAQPIWLREKLKGGAKLADFAVNKSHRKLHLLG